jgi:hypothetical protein
LELASLEIGRANNCKEVQERRGKVGSVCVGGLVTAPKDLSRRTRVTSTNLKSKQSLQKKWEGRPVLMLSQNKKPLSGIGNMGTHWLLIGQFDGL